MSLPKRILNALLQAGELQQRVLLGILMVGVIGIPVIYGGIPFTVSLFALCVFATAEYVIMVKQPRYKILLFIVTLFGCIYYLRFSAGGLQKIVLLAAIIAIFDTAAYFVGRTIGKHKLAPNISPNKTIEGFVGGVIFSVVCTLPLHYLLSCRINLGYYILITASLAILSQYGDLLESALKRKHGIKDSGNLIPGHGGILDRFDGYMLTAPFLAFLNVLLETYGIGLFS